MKPLHVLHPLAAALAAGLLGASLAAHAQDRADIDRTQIIGNRELPKVLYIAPWKKPVPGDLSGRPLASVLDEALAPVDRDVFRRTVQYDTQQRSIVRPAGSGGALATAAAPPSAVPVTTAAGPAALATAAAPAIPTTAAPAR